VDLQNCIVCECLFFQNCFAEFDGTVKLLSSDGNENWVQVTLYCMQHDETGQVQLGHFNCPVLEKTNRKEIITSTSVEQRVNVVHDCLNQCNFEVSGKAMVEEREVVSHETITYQHDFTNNRYLLLLTFI
jgi:hypothetical protein